MSLLKRISGRVSCTYSKRCNKRELSFLWTFCCLKSKLAGEPQWVGVVSNETGLGFGRDVKKERN
jgi:hypothetical protein